MLRDTKLNPTYSANRSTLQHATARALALGNDITAYGHSVESVTNTARTYSNLPSLTKQTAIYPTEHILVNLRECYSGACKVAYHPGIRKRSLRERFIDTPQNRQLFWLFYRALKLRGISRRVIISSLIEQLG